MKIEIEKLTTLYQYLLDISLGLSLQHLLNYWHFLVEQFRNGMLFRCSFLRIKIYTFCLPNYIIQWLIRLQIGYLDNPWKTNSSFFSKVSHKCTWAKNQNFKYCLILLSNSCRWLFELDFYTIINWHKVLHLSWFKRYMLSI